MSLSNLANIAEIFAGLAILFSIVKVWPAFSNLDQLVKRDKDWRPQLKAIQSGLSSYSGKPCVDLPDVETAMNEILAACKEST